MRSSKASKTPVGPPPTSVSPNSVVREIVNPALFCLFSKATLRTCTVFPFERFSNAAFQSTRNEARQLRVRQNWGWTFPSPYAHNSDALLSIKFDNAKPSHVTRRPSTMGVTTRCPCDKIDHVNGNLAGACLGSLCALDRSLFLRP